MNVKEKVKIELEIDSKPTIFYMDCFVPEEGTDVIMELSNPDYEIKFVFNIYDVTYRKEELTRNEIKIIDSFIDFIKSRKKHNIEYLRTYYQFVKGRYAYKEDKLRMFRLRQMLHYNDILVRDSFLVEEIDGQEYFMLESYCVMPDCDCTETLLSFFKKDCKKKIAQCEFSFLYNYATPAVTELYNIEACKAKEIMANIPHEEKELFKSRHKKLKDEMKPYVLEKMKEQGIMFGHNERERRLGRNEPCHCGSGKKYKKCCLYKDLEDKGGAMSV